MSEVLTVAEAAAATRRHPVTIRSALESGDLHGFQRTERGRWSIRVACLDAWVENRPCEHMPSNVTLMRKTRSA